MSRWNEFRRHSAPVIRTRRWKTLRGRILERDDWRCVKCGARRDLEVDHVKPVRDAPELSFDPSNLQTLCPSCHSRKTRLECGFPPPNPKRQAWREAVEALANVSS